MLDPCCSNGTFMPSPDGRDVSPCSFIKLGINWLYNRNTIGKVVYWGFHGICPLEIKHGWLENPKMNGALSLGKSLINGPFSSQPDCTPCSLYSNGKLWVRTFVNANKQISECTNKRLMAQVGGPTKVIPNISQWKPHVQAIHGQPVTSTCPKRNDW